MPDVFIALEEAAAFESVSYKTLTQRIYRNPQQYKTKSQAREGGGKDQVLISTSSLSAKARKAWRAAQKVEGSEVIIRLRWSCGSTSRRPSRQSPAPVPAPASLAAARRAT